VIGRVVNVFAMSGCIGCIGVQVRRQAGLVVTMLLHRVRVRRKGPAARAARGNSSLGIAQEDVGICTNAQKSDHSQKPDRDWKFRTSPTAAAPRKDSCLRG
jgi:hypothetical protein